MKTIRLLDGEGNFSQYQSCKYDPESARLTWACGAEYAVTRDALAKFLERLTVVSAADERALLSTEEVVPETGYLVRLQRVGRRQAVALFDSAYSVGARSPDWLVSLPDLRRAVS